MVGFLSKCLRTGCVADLALRHVGVDAVLRGPSHARQIKIDVGVTDLAASIKSIGLLQPILVAETGEEEIYELLDGQRRLLAFMLLREKEPGRFSRIPSLVRPAEMKEWEKKTISLHANLLQVPMGKRDRVNAMTVVFDRFGDVEKMAEATSLPPHAIRRCVEASRLPGLLKSAVLDDGLALRAALDAADLHARDRGDPAPMLQTAKDLQSLTARQISYVKKAKFDEPDRPVADIIGDVRSLDLGKHDILISADSDMYSRIRLYGEQNKAWTVGDAAADLVEYGLAANEV